MRTGVDIEKSAGAAKGVSSAQVQPGRGHGPVASNHLQSGASGVPSKRFVRKFPSNFCRERMDGCGWVSGI